MHNSGRHRRLLTCKGYVLAAENAKSGKIARKLYHACQVAAPGKVTGAIGMQPATGLFHAISVGFAGPLPTTTNGKCYIVVSVEHLTE